MEVKYVRHKNIDKKNRTEFLLINWDYEDENDYLAKLFCKEFGMVSEEKVDNIWFSIIKLVGDNVSYELLWHEDTGNMIYSIKQDYNTTKALEERLKIVLCKLNEKLKSSEC